MREMFRGFIKVACLIDFGDGKVFMSGDDFLERILLKARSHQFWQARPVDEALLHKVYAAARMGPTSSNSCPLRLIYVSSAVAKESLLPCLSAGNVDKTRTAAMTVIFCYDCLFYRHMERLSGKGANFMAAYEADSARAEKDAFFNATLQAGYVLLALRAVGLDCGPMGGFQRQKVNDAFLQKEKSWRSFLLCNIGYGDHARLNPRKQRLSFAEACRIV